tara:strand:- start:11860 stop:13707 length:1848 start_codon:yes stop_codon:yes gene_type:complete
MATNIKKKIKKLRNRSFLARDFEAFRAKLIEDARIYFPDKIQDFSESSLGGLLVDMVASVGDSLSFYLDHEFRELDPQSAVELDNILMHLRNAGVDAYGASPASVDLRFSIEVPAEKTSTGYAPKVSALPVLLQGTVTQSFDGITFVTLEDLNFAEKDINGNFLASYEVIETRNDGTPVKYEVSRIAAASSGLEHTDTFTISDNHVAFRELTLSKDNVSTISDVLDGDGNEYYEVSALSQDTIFKAVNNTNRNDALEVPSNLEITPAPRRFVKRYNPSTRVTTIRFGSGDADVLDDDIVPDPSDLSLSLYGRKYTPRFSIDPNSLLKTQTLGISPKNTSINIRYRYGGGLSHNVGAGSISEITQLELEFRNTPIANEALSARQSIKVKNPSPAIGGTNAPTVEDLKALITSARNSQSRVVTREDLLARIFTMPSTFGRVFRASIATNPVNPLSIILYLVSLDRNGNMTVAPDQLKKNLSTYLNEFRLISDAIDILDAKIINFGVKYSVVLAPNVSKVQTIQSINQKIANAMQKKYFQIDQPVIIDDITNIIINSDYVIALSDLRIFPRVGNIENREYSSATFKFEQSTKNGIIFGPAGSIFELRFPDDDIIGSAM